MPTDYFSWTTIVSRADLPVDLRDWASYELPDPVSKAMGGDDTIHTVSPRDQLHFWLGGLIQAAGATALAFLDRGNPPHDDGAAPGTFQEGFVVSALSPQDMPAAMAGIDDILSDADRLSRVLGFTFSDEDLSDWRERAGNGEYLQEDVDVVWFLLSLKRLLQDAQTRGDVVAHAHYVF